MPLFSDPELEIKRNHSSFGICMLKKKKEKKNNRKNKTEKKNIYI